MKDAVFSKRNATERRFCCWVIACGSVGLSELYPTCREVNCCPPAASMMLLLYESALRKNDECSELLTRSYPLLQ